MTDKKLSPQEISKVRELIQKSERPYVGLKKVELMNEIGFQKIVMDDFLQLLLTASLNDIRMDIPAEGLFFAFTRYSQLAKELENRLNEQSHEQP